MTDISATTADLTDLLEKIEAYPDPRRATGEWKQAFKLLQATSLDARKVQHVIGMRDVAGLAEFIRQWSDVGGLAPEDKPDDELCKRALRAFRKRAKLTRLDDESKLGRGPLSKGADKDLAAITPPTEYPNAVWRELVHQGKLRYIGNGLYEERRQ
jgi:hypothetical protein